MIIRLSQKLARKVKLATLESLPLHEDALLDWSMQMFDFDRKQYVIISNTRTLYSAVFLAGRISTPHALLITGLQAIGEQLDDDLLLDAYQDRCTKRSMPVRYAKSVGKSVVGSMNQLITQATQTLADGENLSMVSAWSNCILLSALTDTAGRRYGRSYDVMTRLLEGP